MVVRRGGGGGGGGGGMLRLHANGCALGVLQTDALILFPRCRAASKALCSVLQAAQPCLPR